jgi:hypothetical protein
MRKIDIKVARCFKTKKRIQTSNTQVIIHNNESNMYLFGNHIAKTENGETWINHCGWPTHTTRNRLTALGAKLQFIYKRKNVQLSKLILNNEIMLEGWHKL